MIEDCWPDIGAPWGDLPCPTIDGYSYAIDPGLIRTSFDTGTVRQRRRYFHRPHAFTLRWVVTADVLQTLTEYLNEYGYKGVYVPLVTGANGRDTAMPHLVRLVSAIQVSSQARNAFDVSVQAEMQDYDPACMMASQCTDMSSCVTGHAFKPVSVPVETWNAIAAAWGDDAYWGNPNG